ncbi:MAG: copper resistance protein CopC, partial [Actinomycetota bacterium]|nr:copper resistance protein CopC [Actinomycetota bacterium]
MAAVAVLTAASPAAAHTALDATEPADGARVGPGVGRVVLEFTGPIDPDAVGVRLRGPDGTVIDTPAPRPGDTRVVLTLPRLTANGPHLLRYRVRAADGHPLDGRLRFTVRGAAAEQGDAGQGTDPSEPDPEAATEAPASEPATEAATEASEAGAVAAAGAPAAPTAVSDSAPSGGPSRWLLSLVAVVALAGGLA